MNKLSSVLGAAAVIAIAVVFILQFRPASNAGGADTGPTCAIEVRGGCVATASQFWASYRLIASNADPSRLKAMGLRRKVADGLLEQWLLNQDAKRLGITVSEDDLSADLVQGRARVSVPATDNASFGHYLGLGGDSIRYLQVKGPKTKRFEKKVYEKEVRLRTRLSPEDFRAMQKSEMVAARMRDLVRSRVHVSEAEAYEEYARSKSTASLDYVRFDRRFYADMVLDTSQKAIDAWASSHKDEIEKVWEARKGQILPECRSVREIVVKLDAHTASDEDKAKAKARLDRIRERLAKGEDFASVARGQSDSATATRGGEVGCMLKGKAPKPIEDAVSALGAGKVSDLVATESALYLLKVDQIARDADAEKLGRAQTVRELYITQEAERLALEAARNVMAAAKGKSLKDAIELHVAELKKAKAAAEGDKKDEKKGEKKGDKKDEKKGDKADDDRAPFTLDNHPARPTLESTLPFSAAGDPITGVRSSAEVTKMAFALEKPGDVGPDVIQFEGGYIAVALKEKSKASQEEWDKDRVDRIAQLRAYKADGALAAYVKRLQTALAADAKYTKDLVDEGKARDEGAPMPDDGD